MAGSDLARELDPPLAMLEAEARTGRTPARYLRPLPERCRNGHRMAGDNLWWRKSGRRERIPECRTCKHLSDGHARVGPPPPGECWGGPK